MRMRHHRNPLCHKNREGIIDFSIFSKKVWIKCNLPLERGVLESTGASGVFIFSLHFGSVFLHPGTESCFGVTRGEDGACFEEPQPCNKEQRAKNCGLHCSLTSLKILSVKTHTSFLTRFFNFFAALLKIFIQFFLHYGICSISQSTSSVPNETTWNFIVRTEYFLPANEIFYFDYLERFRSFHR